MRQAKKIIKNQIIRCRSRIDGPEDVVTGGTVDYRPHQYIAALRRALAWESRQRTLGTIARCAKLYNQINRVRAGI